MTFHRWGIVACVATCAAVAGGLGIRSMRGDETPRAVGNGAGASPDVRALQQAHARRDMARPMKPSLGTVTFPAGTSYREALGAIFMGETAGIAAGPAATVTDAPMPDGVVIDTRRDGVRVSLAAPYGYDPASRIPLSLPLVAPPPGTPARRATHGWLQGSALPIPTLPACMTAVDGVRQAPACGPKDLPVIGGPSHEPDVPLP